MKKFLLTVWQFPQIVVGFFILLYYKTFYPTFIKEKDTIKDINCYYISGFHGGISLGTYIFLNYRYIYDANYIKHEYGHTIQSKYLGWFYVLIIGIPSIIWAWLYGPVIKKEGKKYYTFYTEKWADKLGGVIRD